METCDLPRLLLWAAAYEDWMAERRARVVKKTALHAKNAMQRLFEQLPKMPWTFTPADIETHAAWLLAQGYARTTVRLRVGCVIDFFRWCHARRIDPECPPEYNPGEGVRRPQVRFYEGRQLLSREEVDRLLALSGDDESPLGRRDHAYLLCRLWFGVPLKWLRQLRWGQIEHACEYTGAGECAGKAWVRWRPEMERQPLPEEVWEAMRAALQAGGRWDAMQPEEFIFAPLKQTGTGNTGSRAEEWVRTRALNEASLLSSIRFYGQALGIEARRLTHANLRLTGARLALDRGANMTEMHARLGSRGRPEDFFEHLKKLPVLPEEAPGRLAPEVEGATTAGGLPELRVRGYAHVILEPQIRHGLYTRRLPVEAVLALIEENVQGLEEIVVGQRVLERCILERLAENPDRPEAGRLMAAYSQAVARMGNLLQSEKRLEEAETGKQFNDPRSAWKNEAEWLASVKEVTKNLKEELEQIKLEDGLNPEEEAMLEKMALAEGQGLPEDGRMVQSPRLDHSEEAATLELDLAARSLVEEIAALRYVMRNLLRLGEGAAEVGELVRYTDLYGKSGLRLANLLRSQRSQISLEVEKINATINQVLQELADELKAYEDQG